jgi:hypothetical protein
VRDNPEKASLLAHLLADRRYAAMLGLGFSAGIPYLLVYVTQSAWLWEAKVPIETIGLMSELTIAHKFKFVWALCWYVLRLHADVTPDPSAMDRHNSRAESDFGRTYANHRAEAAR